jgi:hypothetical protein
MDPLNNLKALFAEALDRGRPARQKRYAEAEPLLIQAYEGLKAREAKLSAPSQNDWPRPPRGSSRSTTPGAGRTRPRRGGRA